MAKLFGSCDFLVYTKPPDERLDAVLSDIKDVVTTAIVASSVYVVKKLMQYGIRTYVVRIDDDGVIREIAEVVDLKLKPVWQQIPAQRSDGSPFRK